MLKKDREVRNIEEIYSIISACKVMRIAMHDEPSPYIVPLSFGCELSDGKIILYAHSATQGKKLELLRANPQVCVEFDNFICTQIAADKSDATTRYESVIGRGRLEELQPLQDKKHAMQCMSVHYGIEREYSAESCKIYDRTAVFRIVLDEVTGKRNPIRDDY